MNKTQLYLKISAIALLAIVVVIIVQSGYISFLASAAKPLIIGVVIAYLVNIIMARYERLYFPKSEKKFVKKTRRPVCLTAALLTILAIIVLVIALIVPELVKAVALLIEKLPGALDWLFSNEIVLALLPEGYLDEINNINWIDTINKLLVLLQDKIEAIAQTVTGAIVVIFGGIANFVIGLIFALYLLASKEKLGGQLSEIMESFLPKKWDGRLRRLFSTANRCFHSFIVGQVTDACVLGLLCTLGLLILRMPYAAMIGVLVGFTALIPIVGAYIGAGVGAFLILTESPVKALIFLVFLVLLQQFEGNLIYPKIVGDKVGLPAMWVLVAVIAGGGLGGISGMLIGVPLAATIYSLIRQRVYKHREEKALPEGASGVGLNENTGENLGEKTANSAENVSPLSEQAAPQGLNKAEKVEKPKPSQSSKPAPKKSRRRRR